MTVLNALMVGTVPTVLIEPTVGDQLMDFEDVAQHLKSQERQIKLTYLGIILK